MAVKSEKPVIAVTGGGQGIGKGIILYFAEHGYNAAVLDINRENAKLVAKECEDLGAEAIAVHCDVTDRDSVKKAYGEIFERYGRLDVQVNNAGILKRERIMDATPEVVDAVIDVNVRGVINTSHAAMQIMVPQRSGSIITAHSLLGDAMPDFGLGVYSASKSFVRTLTRVMAAECAPYGIRVNGYAPSVTASPMVQNIIDNRPVEKLNQISMREFGTPEQVGKVCWFLASDLSEYTTGATIPVDGGTWVVQRPFKAWEAAGLYEHNEK